MLVVILRKGKDTRSRRDSKKNECVELVCVRERTEQAAFEQMRRHVQRMHFDEIPPSPAGKVLFFPRSSRRDASTDINSESRAAHQSYFQRQACPSDCSRGPLAGGMLRDGGVVDALLTCKLAGACLGVHERH